jgi:hypothetical protein
MPQMDVLQLLTLVQVGPITMESNVFLINHVQTDKYGITHYPNVFAQLEASQMEITVFSALQVNSTIVRVVIAQQEHSLMETVV